jgi:uncharacterized protein YdcH (DUF465 family)
MMMTEFVLDRFPGRRDEIERCFAQDSIFRQICEDYAEISRALAQMGGSPGQSDPQTSEDYVNLLRELEEEIAQALQRSQERHLDENTAPASDRE